MNSKAQMTKWIQWAAALVAMAVLFTGSASAATQYASGPFTWGTDSNWSFTLGGPYNTSWTTGNAATFEGTAGTVSIATVGVTANNLTFSTPGYTITNNTLTLSGTAPTVALETGINALIASRIAGNAGLTKSGAGTLTVSGLNTYVGPTTISAGTLKLQQPVAEYTLPALSAALWLRADAITGLNDGDKVATWTDQSGNNRNAANITADQQPVYKTNIQNGRPVLRFDGSNDRLAYNGTFLANTDYTIFIVEARGDTDANYILYGTTGSINQNLHLGYRGNTQFTHAQYSNDYNMDVLGYLSPEFKLYSVDCNATESKGKHTWRNGALLGSLANNTRLSAYAGAQIGGNNGGYKGDIAEIIMYTRALSDVERAQVEEYLINKWSLSSALPALTAVALTDTSSTLDMNGVSLGIGSLTGVAGSQVLLNSGVLAVGNDNTVTAFSGTIMDGTTAGGALLKVGTGALTLAGANTYTGLTKVNGGILNLNGSSPTVVGGITMNGPGGTFVRPAQPNQFGAGVVANFESASGSWNRLELFGQNQTLAGINTGTASVQGGGVIQNSEANGAAGAPVTLTLNGSGTYVFNGHLRDYGNPAAGTHPLSLIKEGSGTQTVVGSVITYSGTTTVNEGVLICEGAASTGVAGTTVGPNGTLTLNSSANNTLRGPVTVAGLLQLQGTFVHTVGGNYTLNSGTLDSGSSTGGENNTYGAFYYSADRAITANGTDNVICGSNKTIGIANAKTVTLNTPLVNDSLLISGTITNQNTHTTGGITKAGLGTVTLTAANGYTGPTTINGGTLKYNGSVTSTVNVNNGGTLAGTGSVTGTVNVNNGGTLAGTGSVIGTANVKNGGTLTGTGSVTGTVNVNNGGTVAPGDNGVGPLSVSNLVLNGSTLLAFEFGGATNDTINVSGDATINGGSFYLYQSGTTDPFSAPGTYNLIKYATLAGAGVGSLAVANEELSRKYTFGTSDDWITLTITAESASGQTWNGGDATSSTWNQADNWGGTAPVANDLLTFGSSGASRTSNINDFAPNTPFNRITFAENGGYTLSGNAVNLKGSVYNTTTAEQTIDLDLLLGGYNAFDVVNSGSLVVNGRITDDGAGKALIKTGAGTMTVSGINTYAGPTTINAGTLKLQKPPVAEYTLPTLSAALWLRADAITGLNDGDQVATWTDHSGNNRNATNGTADQQPVYKTNIQNGRPVLRFDGSNDRLAYDGTFLANTDYTVFIVEARGDTAQNYILQGTAGSGNQNLHLGYRNNTQFTHAQFSNDYDINVLGYFSPEFKLYAVDCNAAEGKGKHTWKNGTLLGSKADNTRMTAYAGAQIGGNGGGYKGDIAEIIMYTNALSVVERTQVEQYLMKKWSLSEVLPTASPVTVASDAILDVNNNSQTVGSLAGAAGGQVLLNGGVLTVGNDNTPTTFSGTIIDGTTAGGGFSKEGAGDLRLDGDSANTFTGVMGLLSGKLGLDKSVGTAVGGNVVAVHNLDPVIYALKDNQFAPGAVMNFIGDAGGHVRFELLGTTQTLAGIDSSGGRAGYGIIQTTELSGQSPVDSLSTLILNGSGSYSFSGYLRDNGSILELVKNGSGTQTLAGNGIDHTGATTVTQGRLRLYNNDDAHTSALAISGGATVEIYRDTATTYEHQKTITISGAGTLEKTGNGFVYMNAGLNCTVSMDSGAKIDVKEGTLRLDSGFRSFWDNNKADLNIASGATFDQWDKNATGVFVDALTGAGSYIKGMPPVNAGNGTLTVGVDNGSGDFSGVLKDGTGAAPCALSFTKTGSGVQTLSGTNTYTGITTISAGTLQVGNGTSDGSIAGNIVNNALLVYNIVGSSTYAGVISGSGILAKIGTGTLALTNANTYTGTTTVNGGILKLTTVANVLPTVTGLVLSNGGKLDLDGVNQTVTTLTLDGALKRRGNCTWGSTDSSAQYRDNKYFSGTGVLMVLGPIEKGTLMLVR